MGTSLHGHPPRSLLQGKRIFICIFVLGKAKEIVNSSRGNPGDSESVEEHQG